MRFAIVLSALLLGCTRQAAVSPTIVDLKAGCPARELEEYHVVFNLSPTRASCLFWNPQDATGVALFAYYHTDEVSVVAHMQLPPADFHNLRRMFKSRGESMPGPLGEAGWIILCGQFVQVQLPKTPTAINILF